MSEEAPYLIPVVLLLVAAWAVTRWRYVHPRALSWERADGVRSNRRTLLAALLTALALVLLVLVVSL